MNNNKLNFFKGVTFGLVISAFMWTGIIWSANKFLSKNAPAEIHIEQSTSSAAPIVLND